MSNHFHFFSLRGIFFFVIAFVAMSMASCEKDVQYSQMFLFYEESLDLPEATVDSIKYFNNKFCRYVTKNPSSMQDDYFVPTVRNIEYAADIKGLDLGSLYIRFTIDTTWVGETAIDF